MKENITLTVFSLLSIILGTLHLADDIVRGMSPGGLTNIFAILIFALALYATVVLAGRTAGYVIILLVSFVMAGIPVIHMRGHGFGPGTIRSDGFFFAWTLLALGSTGVFTFILAARALWNQRRQRSLLMR